LLVEGRSLSRWRTKLASRAVVLTEGPGDEVGDVLAESLAWPSPDRAIVASNNGRLWLVDPLAGRVIDEACVEGHAPGPIGTIWPTLTDQTGIASNLSFFTGGPSAIVSVHSVPTGAGGPMRAVHLAAWHLARITS
jgi:hypothetical protein